MPEIPPPYTRHETTAQRADRRYNELLQELRVTQTGIQVLLGFLFSVVFSSRFKELTGDQRTLYIITLMLGASATAVLVAPVSFHRILFGRRMKPELVRAANLLTLLGLGLLMCTISAAVLLVFEVVLHGSAIAWLAAGVIGWFVLLWYLVPLWLRLRRNVEWVEDEVAPEREREPDAPDAPDTAGAASATASRRPAPAPAATDEPSR